MGYEHTTQFALRLNMEGHAGQMIHSQPLEGARLFLSALVPFITPASIRSALKLWAQALLAHLQLHPSSQPSIPSLHRGPQRPNQKPLPPEGGSADTDLALVGARQQREGHLHARAHGDFWACLVHDI